MSTAPSGWQNPKTNWGSPDVPLPPDFNRIEGNINAIETGARTLDPAQAPTGNVGTLRQFLDWFANRIKAITGTANWYDAPPTTLKAAKSHIDAAAPHSGHETPTGAQTKVDAHANLTAAHSATSAAIANRIMMRDSAGRAKVAAPAAADDIARKDTVDAKFDPSTGHKHTGAAGDGPKIDPATGLTWVPIRYASGSYVGDGTTGRSISIGFAAKLVFILSSNPNSGLFATLDTTGGTVHQTNWHRYFTTDFKISGTSFIVGVVDQNGYKMANQSNVTHYWHAIG